MVVLSIVVVDTVAMVAACLVDVGAADIGIVAVFDVVVVVVVAVLDPEFLRLSRGARRLGTFLGRSAVFSA